jgi:3-oxoadipate enol-lactonase
LSELGSEPHSVATLAADLAALLEALDIQRAVVCGLSLGGLVAQQLAFSAPERVSALCLCATALRIGAPELWAERSAVVRARGLAPLAESIVERWFSPAFRREHALEVRGSRTMLERHSLEGYLAALDVLRDADLSGQASSIRVPAFVLAGEADVATPPARVRELAQALPGARFLTLAQAGHHLPVEQPAAVARALSGFLEEVGLV